MSQYLKPLCYEPASLPAGKRRVCSSHWAAKFALLQQFNTYAWAVSVRPSRSLSLSLRWNMLITFSVYCLIIAHAGVWCRYLCKSGKRRVVAVEFFQGKCPQLCSRLLKADASADISLCDDKLSWHFWCKGEKCGGVPPFCSTVTRIRVTLEAVAPFVLVQQKPEGWSFAVSLCSVLLDCTDWSLSCFTGFLLSATRTQRISVAPQPVLVTRCHILVCDVTQNLSMMALLVVKGNLQMSSSEMVNFTKSWEKVRISNCGT